MFGSQNILVKEMCLYPFYMWETWALQSLEISSFSKV